MIDRCFSTNRAVYLGEQRRWNLDEINAPEDITPQQSRKIATTPPPNPTMASVASNRDSIKTRGPFPPFSGI